MTIAHGLETTGSDPSAPTVSPVYPAVPPTELSTSPMLAGTVVQRRFVNSESRAQTAVKITLALVIVGLVYSLSFLPRTPPTRDIVEAERLCVELRLTLAEMRVIVAEYHAAHGNFPGAAPAAHSDPLWLEQQLDLAFRRAESTLPKSANHPPLPRVPHVEGAVLENPLNHRSNVRFLSPTEPWPLAGDDSSGWLYRPATGEIRANSPGTSPWSGNRFIDM